MQGHTFHNDRTLEEERRARDRITQHYIDLHSRYRATASSAHAGPSGSNLNRQLPQPPLPAIPPSGNYRPSPSRMMSPQPHQNHLSQATPQPPIAEEDECPVCHRELPRRTLPDFETLREQHITTCIATHSAYNGAPSGSAGGNGNDLLLPRAPPRRSGMFPYTATEKDCVDSAECSICLEEFEVGVPMARLECLCRFHRLCIAAWWERHPGRCPMHQHEDFGY